MSRIPPCGKDMEWHSWEREQPVQRPGSHSPVKSTWGAAPVLGAWGVGMKLQAWSGGSRTLDAPVLEPGVRVLGAAGGGGALLVRCPILLSSSVWGQSPAARTPETQCSRGPGKRGKLEHVRNNRPQRQELPANTQPPTHGAFDGEPTPEHWSNLEGSGKVLFCHKELGFIKLIKEAKSSSMPGGPGKAARGVPWGLSRPGFSSDPPSCVT